MPETENAVERAYWEAIRRMTIAERFRRTCSLHDSMIRMLRHRMSRRHPGWSERQIRLQAAAIIYQSDPGVIKLLRQAGLT
jgi:hypothetical protein